MSDDKHRMEIAESHKNQAIIYLHLFEEMSTEFGAEKATELMKRAINKFGIKSGHRYAKFSPRDLGGLRDAFMEDSPADGALFEPVVDRCDDEALDITFRRCPLKEAWLEAGLKESEVARLCEIAESIDSGIFQGNGFEFSADTYKPGGDGCCRIHIRPRK
jgi:hypothetical protein